MVDRVRYLREREPAYLWRTTALCQLLAAAAKTPFCRSFCLLRLRLYVSERAADGTQGLLP